MLMSSFNQISHVAIRSGGTLTVDAADVEVFSAAVHAQNVGFRADYGLVCHTLSL